MVILAELKEEDLSSEVYSAIKSDMDKTGTLSKDQKPKRFLFDRRDPMADMRTSVQSRNGS